MAEKRYEVISDKYVGKHRVYRKGQVIAESEIIGGDEGKELALKGQTGMTRAYASDGKTKDGKPAPARKLKDVPVKLKPSTKKDKK